MLEKVQSRASGKCGLPGCLFYYLPFKVKVLFTFLPKRAFKFIWLSNIFFFKLLRNSVSGELQWCRADPQYNLKPVSLNLDLFWHFPPILSEDVVSVCHCEIPTSHPYACGNGASSCLGWMTPFSPRHHHMLWVAYIYVIPWISALHLVINYALEVNLLFCPICTFNNKYLGEKSNLKSSHFYLWWECAWEKEKEVSDTVWIS